MNAEVTATVKANNLIDVRPVAGHGYTAQCAMTGNFHAVAADGTFLMLFHLRRGTTERALRTFVPQAPVVAAHTPIMLPLDYKPNYIDDQGRSITL